MSDITFSPELKENLAKIGVTFNLPKIETCAKLIAIAFPIEKLRGVKLLKDLYGVDLRTAKFTMDAAYAPYDANKINIMKLQSILTTSYQDAHDLYYKYNKV